MGWRSVTDQAFYQTADMHVQRHLAIVGTSQPARCS
jgi:hypothetical protein